MIYQSLPPKNQSLPSKIQTLPQKIETLSQNTPLNGREIAHSPRKIPVAIAEIRLHALASPLIPLVF